MLVCDPNLRSGWEPDTPAEDTLLRRFLANWTASLAAHGKPLGGRCQRQDAFAAVDLGRPSLGGNVATLLAPPCPQGVPDLMSALNDFYKFASGACSGSVYLFSPWPIPDLRPYGWSLLDYQPLMLRPAGGAAPPAPPGLRIEEVRDAAGLRACEAALVRGFEANDLAALGPGAAFGDGMLADARVRLWVGWEDDRPVTAAVSFIAAGINNVTLVATVPEARRRGYGAAVTWRATLADPALPTVLIATAEGQPVYAQMGYLPLFRFSIWSRDRPTPAIHRAASHWPRGLIML